MKILYHSAPPMADTGYGVHTKNLAARLKNDHDIAIHSVGGFEGMGIDWEGIQVYPSGAGDHGERSIPYWFDETGSDVVFSHHDHWAMADTFRQFQDHIPTILYTILDHDLPGGIAPDPVVKANEKAYKSITISKWAEDRLKQTRVKDEQIHRIPHGVNTSKYAPVTDLIPEEELKEDLGIPKDGFLFGMVAANYGPRKNLPNHIQAFKRFLDEYGADDAYMYIHTHPTMGGGYNLYEVRDAMNIDEERLIFPDAHKMYHGIEDLVVVQLYNTFDVHMNVSQSEGWGLTVTEAMSCETPVIAANHSAMTEQFNVSFDYEVNGSFEVMDHGLLVNRGNELWTQNATARRWQSSVEDIYQAMIHVYENQSELDGMGENAREFVVDNYDWDYLYENEWKPFFDEIEEDVGSGYNEWYMDRRELETQSGAFNEEAKKITFEIRGNEILDVGCGPGTLVEKLDDTGYDVVGVDHAEAAVEKCEEKGLEVYQDDIRSLSFKDDSFDTAIAQHVLEHIEADAYALSELVRVSRRKVILILPRRTVVDANPDDTEVRRYSESEIKRLIEETSEIADVSLDYEKIKIGSDNFNWVVIGEVQ